MRQVWQGDVSRQASPEMSALHPEVPSFSMPNAPVQLLPVQRPCSTPLFNYSSPRRVLRPALLTSQHTLHTNCSSSG